MPSATLIHDALAAHQRGDWKNAEVTYRSILADDPNHIDAVHLLGLVCLQTGRLTESVALLEMVLRQRPDVAPLHNNLGLVLLEQGQSVEAEKCFREALRLDGAYPQAANNLGLALKKQGRLAEATALFTQAVRLRHDYAEAYSNLGATLRGLGQLVEAERCLRQALTLRPGAAEPLSNLGLVLHDLDRLDDAESSFRQSLARKATPEAHNNLGVLLQRTSRLPEAAASYRAALAMRQDYHDPCHNLGRTLRELGDLAGAEAALRQALELQPEHSGSLCSLGAVLYDCCQLDEAEQCYSRALEIDPSEGDAHLALGELRLLQGRWPEAWPEFAWRKRAGGVRAALIPDWDGSDLTGKRILLDTEDDLADALQLVRYARLVKARGAEVWLRCPAKLTPLLAHHCPGVDHVIGADEPLPDADVQAALIDLPGFFDTTPERVPSPEGYLSADPRRREFWRQRLASLVGTKVGIVWEGDSRRIWNRRRSAPLDAFKPLARVLGVNLIGLQKGAGAEQLESLGPWLGVVDLGEEYQQGTMADAAALVSELDLIVSVDALVVHLAGSLGTPVWLALPHVPDGRWLLERDDSPWYRSLRLFRQPAPGRGGSVFHAIAAELQQASHPDRSRKKPAKEHYLLGTISL